MTTTGQETLLDYTPTQEEEVARLKALAEKMDARIEALFNDPVFAQAEANAKAIDKKIKEMEKVRNELNKITIQLGRVDQIQIEEPKDEGFYIFSQAVRGYHRDGRIRTTKSLLLKAFGEWFNLDENDGSNTLPNWNGKAVPFSDFLDVDQDAIEVTLIKLEDTSRYPKELLKDVDEVPEDEISHEDEDSAVDE